MRRLDRQGRRRFADILADACARLGADVVCYSFIVTDLHQGASTAIREWIPGEFAFGDASAGGVLCAMPTRGLFSHGLGPPLPRAAAQQYGSKLGYSRRVRNERMMAESDPKRSSILHDTRC